MYSRLRSNTYKENCNECKYFQETDARNWCKYFEMEVMGDENICDDEELE